jgi:hypothetical protein
VTHKICNNHVAIADELKTAEEEPLRWAERLNYSRPHLNAGRVGEEHKAGDKAFQASTLLKKTLIEVDW